MKKIGKKLIFSLVVLVIAFIYYYVSLPAINIHSVGFWWFLILAIVMIGVIHLIRKTFKGTSGVEIKANDLSLKGDKFFKLLLVLLGVVIVVFIVGDVLSSPFINARKYQTLLTVEEGDFATDVEQVDYTTIPLLDKASASILGERKMGSMVDMVSQFTVSSEYTQINYKGRPVRVTPLSYASPIKWLTNQSNGIPAYILIDMSTQETECVKLSEGIRYSKAEYFNRNIYRHLRFNYPTYIFDSQIFFEIDEEGTPYWVCPVKKFNVGLFGGQTIGKVVLCNAISGECVEYEIDAVPEWIDKVYSAELLTQLYDYYGTLKHGFWNSVLTQKDCLQTTNGYNYIAMNDDVWVYTGVTSVSADESNVGFVLMNQRTMETRYYRVEGAIEDSAMSSAEGQVQHLGYQATFPLLLNVDGKATYFMALKDAAGLVKMYAMVNVEQYQYVAIGDTIKECEENYYQMLMSKGMMSELPQEESTITGTIEVITPIVLEGTTHYYVFLKESNDIFDFDMSNTKLVGILRCQPGDRLTLSYETGMGIHKVTSFE